MRIAVAALIASSSCLALSACEPAPVADDASVGSPDAYAEPADAGTDAATPSFDVCDELGLPRRPFDPAGAGSIQGEAAGDFTAQTLAGPFHLAERWTGCDNYVFYTYFPNEQGDALYASLFRGSLLNGPRNAHYFFSSYEEDEVARLDRASNLAEQLEMAFGAMVPDEADRAFWRSRFHFVTDRATEIEGSPGAYMQSYLDFARDPMSVVDLGDRGRAGLPYPFVFGIDREQRFDSGDDLSPTVGTNPTFGMGQYLARWYDYRYALEQRFETETATVVPLLDDERTTGRVFTRTVTLPDAAAMAAYDSLEFDVAITCEHRNLYGCSEWDRIASVSLCVDGETCADRREITRWITPYWRRGRQHWGIDATPFLGLLRAGGAQTFRIELGPDWERATEWVARVAMRLRTRGGEPRATGGVLAFTGGAFDATYNTREPVAFTVPATATRVELVTILSGHGQTEGDNCAEWCDHRHTFSVNGTALAPIAHTGAAIGTIRACAERASEGVVPGQGGNWSMARAYWCPGLPVIAERRDITTLVTPGMEASIDYEASFGTMAPRGGDIALSAYVVWYE
jgi:hypothetical protein